jgi:hypothetical protein
MERQTITEIGCYLDGHRGHYIIRDMIQLAEGWGFIIGPFEQFALAMYEDHNHEENYPHEGLHELADEALNWLNIGDNEGLDRPIKFQNSPPIIPEGTAWGWNEGDFGLYDTVLFTIWDADKRSKVAEDLNMREAREFLSKKAFVRDEQIERFLAQGGDDIALQIGGYTVEANWNE